MQLYVRAKRFFLGFVCLFSFVSLQVQSRTTFLFLDSADPDYVAVYQNLPVVETESYVGASDNYEDVTLVPAWSAYDFSTTYNAAGYNGTGFGPTFTGDQRAAAAEIVAYVHSHGGKVCLGYGGGTNEGTPWVPSYAISQSASWLIGDIDAIVDGLGEAVAGTGADGVFLSFQDSQPGNRTPQGFAAELVAFVRALRAAYPELPIIVGVQGQGWGRWQEDFVKSLNSCECAVDNIFVYEYGIPQVVENSYPEQVVADFQTYAGFNPILQPAGDDPAVSSYPFPPFGVSQPNDLAAWGLDTANLCLGLEVAALKGHHGAFTAPELAFTFAVGPTNGPHAFIPQFPAIALWDLNQDARLDVPYELSTVIRVGLATPSVSWCTTCYNASLVRKRGGFRSLPIRPSALSGEAVFEDINLMDIE